MKRAFVFAALIALLFGAADATRVYHVPSAATNYGISLPTMVQSFAVMPHTADISVETYIGTTAQDSFLVKAGSGLSVYSPCDSIYIIRPTATAVTVNPSFDNRIQPAFYGAGGVDSLVDLMSGPEPVSVVSYNLVSDMTMKLSGSQTYPWTAAPNLDGAKAVMLILDWDRFTTNGFAVQPIFAPTLSDSGCTFLDSDGSLDTISVNVTAVYDTAGVTGCLAFPIKPWSGNSYAGFFFIRFFPWAGNDVDGMNATLKVVY